MTKNIVVLAGGVSSRMKQQPSQQIEMDEMLRRDAETRPKSMIGVGEHQRPFLDYLLMNAVTAGYRECVLVVNDRDEDIQAYYGNQKRIEELHGLAVTFAIQEIPEGRTKPMGTADALLCALRSRPDWAGSYFTVCNSDNLYSVRALSLIADDSHNNAMIDYDRSELEFPRARIAAFAVVRKDSDSYLADIIEKPSVRDIESVRDHNGRVGVSMNLFRFAYNQVLPCLERVPVNPLRNEKELPDAVRFLVQTGRRAMITIPVAEHVPDLTSRDDIMTIKRYLEAQFRLYGAAKERSST